MLRRFLIQKEWYRNLFPKNTYYLNNSRWYNLKEFKVGTKIEDITGHWTTQAYCKCGNELIHSDSFIKEYYNSNSAQFIYHYNCTYCKKESFYNPNIIPGLMPCDKNGIPY